MTREIPHLDYGLLADVEFSHPRLPLARATSRASETVVEYEYRRGRNDGATHYFTAAFGDLDGLEAAFVADDTVRSVECLAVREASRVYRVQLGPEATRFFEEMQAFDAFVRRMRGSNGDWSVRMLLRDRAALATINDYCRENDVRMHLNHLRSAGEVDSHEYFGLSPSECEMLRLAYETGYYSVPRQITQTRLAESLGVSASAISQQLRRATAALIRETLVE